MFTTANESSEQTLTRLIRAMDSQHPATITYLKEEKDTTGKKTGQLVETVRTIEIYDIRITKAGDTLIVAMDRETQERRTFRADRLVSYSIHRTAYTVPRETEVAPAGHGLAAATTRVARLTPATLTTAARVDVLARFLTTAA